MLQMPLLLEELETLANIQGLRKYSCKYSDWEFLTVYNVKLLIQQKTKTFDLPLVIEDVNYSY